jgi:nicotinate-nucleotide adenylyltransferase
MTRIGLFGGTFDPVHLAHLRTAEEVREALDLDRVDLVLSATPPHKAPGTQATSAHRRRMLELAIADAPRFGLELCEVERDGPSYSIDTIREVQARDPRCGAHVRPRRRRVRQDRDVEGLSRPLCAL